MPQNSLFMFINILSGLLILGVCPKTPIWFTARSGANPGKTCFAVPSEQVLDKSDFGKALNIFDVL